MSNYSSGHNKSLCNEKGSKNEPSPSASIIANPRHHSGIHAGGASSPAHEHPDGVSDIFLRNNGSFSVFEYDEAGSGSRNLKPGLAKGFYSTKRTGIVYRLEIFLDMYLFLTILGLKLK